MPALEREGILLCFRSDKESLLCEDVRKRIRVIAGEYSEKTQYTSTVLPFAIQTEERGRYLEEKINEFKRSELVITDRLHGMIFAAITGTPCIALNNSSKKVEGVYQWIRKNDYIRFVWDIDDVSRQIEELVNMQPSSYDNSDLMPYFDLVAEIMKDVVIG